MSIYVGNLSFKATEADVTNVFKEYGEVKKVYLPSDRETGKMRGFGFVDMETDYVGRFRHSPTPSSWTSFCRF